MLFERKAGDGCSDGNEVRIVALSGGQVGQVSETASISMRERVSAMMFALPERWCTLVVNSEMVARCLACMANGVSAAFVIMPTRGAWSVNRVKSLPSIK